jgi:hypothetical protein
LYYTLSIKPNHAHLPCMQAYSSSASHPMHLLHKHLRTCIIQDRKQRIQSSYPRSPRSSSRCVTEPTNYTRLSKKIIHRANDLANLSPYNPVVREIVTDFKPTYIPAKIVISLAVTITSYIKIHITNTSEFKHSYYKPVSNESSRSI